MVKDLNEVVYASEKFSGKGIWKKWLFFKDFLQNVGGIDLGFSGYSFNWESRQEGQALIKERLNRAMAKDSWMEAFLFASVQHLRRKVSDHCLILIQTTFKRKLINRPFQFFKTWTIENSSNKVVANA